MVPGTSICCGTRPSATPNGALAPPHPPLLPPSLPPLQVQLEEGGLRVPVTIRGLSSNGYLLVGVCACRTVSSGRQSCGCVGGWVLVGGWFGGGGGGGGCQTWAASGCASRACTQRGRPHAHDFFVLIQLKTAAALLCRPLMRRGSGTSCTQTATLSTSSTGSCAKSCPLEAALRRR